MNEAITITNVWSFKPAVTTTPEATVRMALEKERDELRKERDFWKSAHGVLYRWHKDLEAKNAATEKELDLLNRAWNNRRHPCGSPAQDEIAKLKADLLATTNELANERYKALWRHDHLLKYLDEHRPES